ncbi:MAG TPA: FAD:protein FMN transferase [Solirubrobacteraceae bacterium]|nr:FAD:protein FMN transferase [Solirubrobacteraceae bacterium]
MRPGEVIFRHSEPVMGTVVSIDVRPRGVPMVRTRAAVAAACEVLHRADDVFSLFQHDTPLARLRRGEIEVTNCPPEVADVIALCEQAKLASGGWFDPWGMPGGFDPTGLVKGWAAREAARVLEAAGVGAAMVNAAGDIASFGTPGQRDAWRVGVRSPESAELLACVIELRGCAVATSGLYERGAHIWDVRAGRPADGVASATVCGDDLALADAFATGLVAAGSAGLDAVTAAGYEALLLLAGGKSVSTAGFPTPAAV